MEAISKQQSLRWRLIQAFGYFIPAAAIGWIILSALMQVFNGLEPHPLMFVGLLACFGLFLAGILTLFTPSKGRLFAACTAAMFLPVLGEWIIALVPLPNVTLGLENYFVPLLYLLATAAVLFLPHSVRFSVSIFIILCAAIALIASATYAKRLYEGHYDPPAVACFRWLPQPSDQLMIHDEIGTINQEVRDMLTTAGIRGTLNWTQASGRNTTRNRMIIILQKRPPNGARLFAPNGGVVVYAFDGESWQKLPPTARTYRSYVQVENDGVQTIFYDPAGRIVSSVQWDH
jgi:hypothetical protein